LPAPLADEGIVISGLKLLVADDSLTIQKVVELTFVDEGMRVASASDGDQAMAQLEEFAPDVVLADVIMPGRTGYEVCAAIKQNERFQHIPVMLLVGSFEPFDEAEARRVGADDVLTKPFQSIRQLVNRVGTLLGGSPAEDRAKDLSENPAEEEANTRKLSTDDLAEGQFAQAAAVGSVSAIDESAAGESEDQPDSPKRLSTAEIELTTADTKPLDEPSAEPDAFASDLLMANPATEYAVDMAQPLGDYSSARESQPDMPLRVERMDYMTEQPQATPEGNDFTIDEMLLDLGDLDAAPAPAAYDDSILELEEEPVASFAAEERDSQGEMVEPAIVGSTAGYSTSQTDYESEFEQGWSDQSRLSTPEKYEALEHQPVHQPETAQAAQSVSWDIVPSLIPVDAQLDESEGSPVPASVASHVEDVSAPSRTAESADSRHLSAADIDAIARRVVEHMSEKVVREIAWEVVPELSELLIKRRLEEGK